MEHRRLKANQVLHLDVNETSLSNDSEQLIFYNTNLREGRANQGWSQTYSVFGANPVHAFGHWVHPSCFPRIEGDKACKYGELAGEKAL